MECVLLYSSGNKITTITTKTMISYLWKMKYTDHLQMNCRAIKHITQTETYVWNATHRMQNTQTPGSM